VSADPGLEPGLGNGRAKQVVLGRLEVAEAFGEHGERPLEGGRHDDLPLDLGGGLLGHGSSLSG
jgi:hypothetical protein